MGTPDFAAVVLERLLCLERARVACVYTQPDRPRGRGMRLVPSPVKTLAEGHGLEVRQPENFRSAEERERLAALAPDLLVVAAYGLLLPGAVLDAARIAPLNVHASLLPRYRGAAPIQRAIMENWAPDAVTGVSLMRMEPSLDTGPVYARKAVPIAGRTAGELTAVLAREGAELLAGTLDGIVAGTVPAVPQDASAATYAAKLCKADGQVDWTLPAARVDALVRGVTPAPGARAGVMLQGAPEPLELRILAGHAVDAAAEGTLPPAGNIAKVFGGLGVACADGFYMLDRVRPSGRKDMTGTAFANGYAPVRALGPEAPVPPGATA